VRKPGYRLNFHSPLGWLMIAYYGCCVLSVCWSIDVARTTRELAVLTFCFFGMLGITRQLSRRDVVALTLAITCAFLLIGLGAELALGTFRPFSPGYRFAGSVHPNTQGNYLATMCLAAFCMAGWSERRRRMLQALFGVGFCFLILTKSRTACVCLLSALVLLWFLRASARRRLLVGIGAALAVSTLAWFFSLGAFDFGEEASQLATLGRQERIDTLNGRIPLWNELLRYIEARPFCGYGYRTFWTPRHIDIISSEVQWAARTSHSSFVGTLLNVGIIGAVPLFLVAVLAACHAAGRYRTTRDPGYAFILGMLVISWITAVTEAISPGLLFVPFIMACGVGQLAFRRERPMAAADLYQGKYSLAPATN
jgi:O-antigen ligase